MYTDINTMFPSGLDDELTMNLTDALLVAMIGG
jgi:hypothetical protein